MRVLVSEMRFFMPFFGYPMVPTSQFLLNSECTLRLHALAGFGKTLAPEATAIADELLRRGLQPLALDSWHLEFAVC